ncbi:MAG: UDP-N-acetylglucosamine 2-epimerase (non-hydrolyzing) [Candidatus Aminicenantales bacterium]
MTVLSPERSGRWRKSICIVTVVGARPQFIKAAMVNRAIRRHNEHPDSVFIKEILVHTGQHYDKEMSQVFFEQLGLPEPSFHLGVGSGSHGKQTAEMLRRIEDVLCRVKPALVLVFGDTNSTLAGALAAAKLHIPVAHVEAGLRSYNRRMPEEINRVLTDRLSRLLFCPTKTAVANLKKEGITRGVHNVGDVMFDAFLANQKLADSRSEVLRTWNLKAGRYCLATVHRQENTDDPERLINIFTAFCRMATKNCPVLIPLHPRTQKVLRKLKSRIPENPHIRIIPPVTYLDMIALEVRAKMILTDSGGVQKEAYFAGVPCITLRDETEWNETVGAKFNIIAGTHPARILKAFRSVYYFRPPASPPLYGRGTASRSILRWLLKFLTRNGQEQGSSDLEGRRRSGHLRIRGNRRQRRHSIRPENLQERRKG